MKDFMSDFQMGLRVPEKEAEIPPFRTCEEMRRIIYEQARDSALIMNGMRQADYNGLSGEDRYTVIAFHALIALEHYFSRNLDMMHLMPMVPNILKEPK